VSGVKEAWSPCPNPETAFKKTIMKHNNRTLNVRREVLMRILY